MFPKWDSCPKVGRPPEALSSYLRGCFVILVRKRRPIMQAIAGNEYPLGRAKDRTKRIRLRLCFYGFHMYSSRVL